MFVLVAISELRELLIRLQDITVHYFLIYFNISFEITNQHSFRNNNFYGARITIKKTFCQ